MPTELTADYFAGLRLRCGAAPQPGELPAAIEHAFEAGRMVDHYLVRPAPALIAVPEAEALGTVTAVVFAQQGPGEAWQVVLHSAEGQRAELTMPEAEFRALLAANDQALPGEPGFVPPQKAERQAKPEHGRPDNAAGRVSARSAVR